MKSLVLAFQFLTICPLPQVQVEPKHFGQSMMFFPLVGLTLGACLYSLHLIAKSWRTFFPLELEAFLLLLLLTVLTRGLHLEGFADFLDGFLGGRDRERILSIIKDSRAGVFAVIGLIFLILGKIFFVYQILQQGKVLVVLVFPVISRWSMVLLCLGAHDPRPEKGLATTFVDSLRFPHFVIASVFAFSVMIFVPFMSSIFYFIFTIFFVVLIRILSTAKIDGITGDVIGATSEIVEFTTLYLGVVL
ncbi:adenosylcobinamide-GDP ribazoletransferase [candidate division KSB1 bacterium]|nr:adenosylcobinamide-GDP ribazoletransferase [candidate division KSB1 bacterium]NIR70917.1 adenosylcobinamide-GDP ribazoletransferase [candidate division KSB1 bacterium]NIS23089.1 adenosylcobinamide-GDP ribazoletransferase [candidate division KSB1 bacterium]NIT69924.1 adenosylcobinamide-GDP ribazoletransferase [candidate division KSB1 bacterium]NIU23590.1 adenosylcobinamide-GDP ribazoletransferase [candidate division KSB1 bacterium]